MSVRSISPDGPTTREEFQHCIALFSRLLGRPPVRINVPLETYKAWSAWRQGPRPNPALDWSDPSNMQAKIFNLEVVVTDYFAME